MLHLIDPRVDYPFKAIFGAEENRDVLIDFLNALLPLPAPVVEVELLNPFSPAEFEDARAGIVDVKARDQAGRLFQIEIQGQVRPRLVPRMLCSWADLYPVQLRKGGDDLSLRPLLALWLLDENLFPDSPRWHHAFELRDEPTGLRLTDHIAIHTVELRKWTMRAEGLDAAQKWIYFLREAGGWARLPSGLDTPALRKAMSVLERIAEKQDDYLRYLARQELQRVERERERLLDEANTGLIRAQAELESKTAALQSTTAELQSATAELQSTTAELRSTTAELQAKEVELQATSAERDAAAAAADRLRARLLALGLDPDAP